jgi:hypothetical protein
LVGMQFLHSGLDRGKAVGLGFDQQEPFAIVSDRSFQ